MWIKLMGLVFVGVFVGATIYEVSQRRRKRAEDAEDAPGPQSKAEEPPAA